MHCWKFSTHWEPSSGKGGSGGNPFQALHWDDFYLSAECSKQELMRLLGRWGALHPLPACSPSPALMFPRCFWLAELKTESSSIFPDIAQNFFYFFYGSITFTPNVVFWKKRSLHLKEERERERGRDKREIKRISHPSKKKKKAFWKSREQRGCKNSSPKDIQKAALSLFFFFFFPFNLTFSC